MVSVWCENYVKIEEQRLAFLRINQNKLKAELYSGLVDAVAANKSRLAGSYIVLPSSFMGSPRHCHMMLWQVFKNMKNQIYSLHLDATLNGLKLINA